MKLSSLDLAVYDRPSENTLEPNAFQSDYSERIRGDLVQIAINMALTSRSMNLAHILQRQNSHEVGLIMNVLVMERCMYQWK